MTKKLALFLSIMAAPALAWGDTLQISCAASTACTAGAVTQITATSVFDLSNQGQPLKGEGYLGIAVPGSGLAVPSIPGLTPDASLFAPAPGKQSKLGTVLGEPGMAGYPFASFASASEQVDVNRPYFLIYEFDLGKYSSIGHGNVGLGPIDISGLAKGDVLVGWVEDSTLCTTGTGKNKKTKPCKAYGDVISQTPLLPSAIGSITFSAPPASTPEPGTLLLLGTGLLAVGSAAQRRFRKK